MTFTDYYDFPTAQLLQDDLLKLKSAALGEKPKLFAAFCQKAIDGKEAGTMPLRDAAYCIAQTMFIHELDEPLFEEITALAGELELPAEFVSGDPEEKWLQLISLVETYKIKLT